jgi:hypothetical protein
MVELVLRNARRMAFELEPDVVAFLVLALERHTQVPLDRHRHALDRQTTLVFDLRLVAEVRESRIDDGHHVVFPFLEDEHALENPDLRGGETDAARVAHQLLHARC